jgi:uncharacterized protein (TIGR03084 family)
MLQQAIDFQTECDALYELLKSLSDEDFERETLFKGWTINTVLQHLHYFNYAAHISLDDEDAILKLLGDLRTAAEAGVDMMAHTDKELDGIKGRALLALWHDYYTNMVPDYEGVDPKKRLKWAGPDMSVLSSITARLMETWSHAQAVYDLLGVVRQDGDHIKNVVVIGNNTFGWTFVNRGEDVPEDKPFLKLTAPSGKVWELNEPSDSNYIEGAATEFGQVVTQCRNIGDTKLNVVGETATKWMAVAQCFAGPPRTPPATGVRHIQT